MSFVFTCNDSEGLCRALLISVICNKEENFHSNRIFFCVQLAQFRQRKAHSDGQHAPKKQKKKKKVSNTKDEESVQEGLDIDQSQGEDASPHSCQRGAAAASDFAIVRTLHSDELIKHDQIYTTEVSVFVRLEKLIFITMHFKVRMRRLPLCSTVMVSGETLHLNVFINVVSHAHFKKLTTICKTYIFLYLQL